MQGYPFTSQVTYDADGLPLYDRAVDSEFLRKVFACYWSDGVFYKPSALQVTADSGMAIRVLPGVCHIQGAIGIQESDWTYTLEDAGSLSRIDTVVARLDLSVAVRNVVLDVVQGVPADTPEAPSLTRNNTIWELGLANILVAKNSASVTAQRVTDTRLDTDRCGVVAQTVGELDTSPYFTQIQALIGDLQAEIAGVHTGSSMMLKEVYDTDNDGVVDSAANADLLGGKAPAYYALPRYAATLLVDGWTAADGGYAQTAACTPQDGGPALAASAQLAGPMCQPTGVQATDETLQAALGIVNRGTTTPGAASVTVKVWELPECDITVHWFGRGST